MLIYRCVTHGGKDMWHISGRSEMYVVVWWGNLKERDHLEDRSIDGRITVKCILMK